MPTRAHMFFTLIVLLALSALGIALLAPKTSAPQVASMPDIVTPPPPAPTTVTQSAPRLHVETPQEHTQVSSPLLISGEAPGTWFFEGSFPVELRDASYALIASGIATSSQDWMTTSMIPFDATLNWASTTATSATLILIKDNPSGLPEHDDRVLIDVSL